jgi:hypothetical protein
MAVEIGGLVPPTTATRAKRNASSASWISAVRGTTTMVVRARWTRGSSLGHAAATLWPDPALRAGSAMACAG